MAQRPRMSEITIVFAIGGAGACALESTIVSLQLLSAGPQRFMAFFGPAFVITVCAVLMGYRAMLLREPFNRRAWTMVAIGAVVYALGDFIWATDNFSSIRPGLTAPTVAYAFFILAYLLYGVAMLMTAWRNRRDAGLAVPLVSSLVIAGIVGMLMTRFVVSPALAAMDGWAVTTQDLALVYGGVALLTAPAVFMLVVIGMMKNRAYEAAWLLMGTGAIILNLADIAWFWQLSTGGWVAGSLVDFGWMFSHVLMVVGASYAVDGERPKITLSAT